MKWYYEIRGSNNRLIEESPAVYNSEKEALGAGGRHANEMTSIASGGTQVLHVMAGQK
jgi:predicted secreted protein